MKIKCLCLISSLTAKYAFVYTHKTPPNGRCCLHHPLDAAASLRNIIRNIIRTDCLLDRAPQDWPAHASRAYRLDTGLATRATRYSQGTDHQPPQSLRQRLLAAGHAPLPGQVQQFPAGYSFHRHLEAFSSDPE